MHRMSSPEAKGTVISHFFRVGPVPCQIVSAPDRVTRFPWLDVVVHAGNPARDSLISVLVWQLYRDDILFVLASWN